MFGPPRRRSRSPAARRGAVVVLLAAAAVAAVVAGPFGRHHVPPALEPDASAQGEAAEAFGGSPSTRLPERAAAADHRPDEGSARRSGARPDARADRWPDVEWRSSRALGLPSAGSLERGVQVPREGRHFFSWDPVERTSPNRPWRRWGADHVVRATLAVLAEHRRAFPRAPRIGIGDLSRPQGGDFGIAYGPIGHASHQNGLDVDVYYPLRSGEERAPLRLDEIDRGLSQDLVDRFVAAGAEKVFVGPSTGFSGPADVVQAIPNHDNHLHVRFRPRS